MPSLLYSAVMAWYASEGFTPSEIARFEGVSVRTVQSGLKRAREAEAELGRPDASPPLRSTPLFGCMPFVPGGDCPHRGPIEHGSPFTCMYCHDSGRDGDPRMQPKRTDPKPDPKPAPPKQPQPGSRPDRAAGPKALTRRERRALARSNPCPPTATPTTSSTSPAPPPPTS